MISDPHHHEVSAFLSRFAVLLRAGRPAHTALVNAAQDVDNPALRGALFDVRRDLDHGLPIGEALRRYPHVFPSVVCGAVSAGEEAGNLGEMLERTAALLGAHDARRSQERRHRELLAALGVLTVAVLLRR